MAAAITAWLELVLFGCPQIGFLSRLARQVQTCCLVPFNGLAPRHDVQSKGLTKLRDLNPRHVLQGNLIFQGIPGKNGEGTSRDFIPSGFNSSQGQASLRLPGATNGTNKCPWSKARSPSEHPNPR